MTVIFQDMSPLSTPDLPRFFLGADGWNDIELYGKCKYKWLKKFLELPNGIPSHDTFSRVFSLLNPEQLQMMFSPMDRINYIGF